MTRLISIFSLLVLVILGSGCVRRQYGALSKPPTRPLTQAQANGVLEQQYLADVVNQEKWKSQLQLECKSGVGREDVIIEPRLGRQGFRVEGGAAAFFFALNMGLVEVTNPFLNATVTIREGSRFQVHNLCPDGTMTLVALLPVDAGMFVGVSPTSQSYTWTADVFMDGKLYKGKSPNMSLWVNSWQREQKAQWTIELENIGRILK